MAISETERRLLDDLAADPSVAFSAADRDALIRGGVPIWCILRAAGAFVICGVTNRECQQAFLNEVLGCFGANRGGGDEGGG